MRISDWSSDVCSSDLTPARNRPVLRSLIDLKPRDVPFRVALRNTIAVVAPLAVGLAIDQVPAGLAMTIGAINTMFTDQPGPYRQRLQRMLMASTVAGLSALGGILVGGHTGLREEERRGG